MFRLVLADLDGTMLDRSHTVSPEALEAVRLTRQASLEFTVATGRAYPAAAHVVERLGIQAPFICAGGATIRRLTGDVLQDKTISRELCAEILSQVPIELDVVAFTSDAGFTRRLSEGVLRYASALGVEFVETRDLVHLPDDVRVLALRGPEEVVTSVREKLSLSLGERAEVEQVLPHLVEIRAKGATKHLAMATLARTMGIGIHEIVAIGDGIGDMGMVAAAGCGVAVCNAVNQLKAVARHITTAPYSGGVLEVVRDVIAGKLPEVSRNSE